MNGDNIGNGNNQNTNITHIGGQPTNNLPTQQVNQQVPQQTESYVETQIGEMNSPKSFDLSDISLILAKDSELPEKDFSYFTDDPTFKVKIRAMSSGSSMQKQSIQEKKMGDIMMERLSKKEFERNHLLHIYNTCVVGWTGLTMYHLSRIFHLRRSGMTLEEMKDQPVPFNDKNKEILSKDITFFEWVLSMADDKISFALESDGERSKG